MMIEAGMCVEFAAHHVHKPELGIGTAGNHLETAIGTSILSGRAGSGGLFITEADDVSVGDVADIDNPQGTVLLQARSGEVQESDGVEITAAVRFVLIATITNDPFLSHLLRPFIPFNFIL